MLGWLVPDLEDADHAIDDVAVPDALYQRAGVGDGSRVLGRTIAPGTLLLSPLGRMCRRAHDIMPIVSSAGRRASQSITLAVDAPRGDKFALWSHEVANHPLAYQRPYGGCDPRPCP